MSWGEGGWACKALEHEAKGNKNSATANSFRLWRRGSLSYAAGCSELVLGKEFPSAGNRIGPRIHAQGNQKRSEWEAAGGDLGGDRGGWEGAG